MRIVSEYRQVHRYSNNNFEWEAGHIFQLILCPACDGISLIEGDWHEMMDLEEWKPIILFPISSKPLAGLPDVIEKAYLAAQKVRNIDSNAFAVLLGRVLDLICINRGATGDSLYERLASLAQKGQIPARLTEMAHKLRQLRNIGAHADLGDLTIAEVPILDDFCRAILEYVYTAPHLIDQVGKRIDELKHHD